MFPHPGLVVVGNKSDLESSREVPAIEGNFMADDYHGVYIECSAKTGEGIQEVFELAAKAAYDFKGRANEKPLVVTLTEELKIKDKSECC